MHSFFSPSRPHAARPSRSFWHKQSGAIGSFGATPAADAEAAQRALLYRSEAFAEDLGPGYAALRYADSGLTVATVAAGR